MRVAVVKYNAGNIYSVVRALQRLGVEPALTDDPALLRGADRVVFPGQGEAAGAMAYLRERGLDEVIRSLTRPVLGVCIGQQLLCRHSEEGDTDCLGVFRADVVRLRPGRREDKVPHMGWDELERPRGPLLEGVPEGGRVYFVHSYCVPPCPDTAALTDYTRPFSAAMARDNFYATQFHPEKSGALGERILRNFLSL